ncbi:OprO/OprP family phosphate-selective porin [Lichenibacterium dinghuense]|uniref:OprO/OprP family phosphate-selective porin n=1 Tax=Lichenibacterium dinghuense TaxID=2895977 RepID=UPI001F23635C|nr:porin [Lichenibacterium sp. 6Y81]
MDRRTPSPSLGAALALALAAGAALAGTAAAAEAPDQPPSSRARRSGPARTERQHAAARPSAARPEPVPSQGGTAGPFPGLPAFALGLPTVGTATLDSKGLGLRSDTSDAVFHIGGRLHYDFGTANLDPKQTFRALSADGSVRRAWFEASLKLDDVLVAFQYDLASATRPVDDAYLSYRPFGGFHVVAGNFKEPFSLEQLESNNTTLFAERSLLDTFSPQRDVGLGFGGNGERWTLMGGAFGGTPVATGIGRFGVAGTARATYAPVLDAVQVLHLGVAGSYRALDRGGTALAFNDKPEDFLFNRSLIATGAIRNADAVGRLGLEGAYQYGSVRLQSEVALTAVSGAGAADRTFQAGYAELGWVLNGPGRRYRVEAPGASEYAVFEGVDVPEERRVSRGGVGVFEVAARVSAIDLRSGPVRGGAERDGSVGVNWYPDANLRLTVDYVHARADPSAASVTGRRVDSDQLIGRAQVYW